MGKLDHAKLYQTQISQTEWLQGMNHAQAEAFRLEDNEKRERLRRLNELIGLPFDRPHQFTALAVASRTPEFEAFLASHGDELCALRLIPLDPSLPKLRMRGLTVRRSLDWFAEQNIDPAKYRADVVPHEAVQLWATTFVLNANGAFGEVVRGSHAQLTQGFYETEEPPIRFAWDFETFQLSRPEPEAQAQLTDILSRLKVADSSVRQQLAADLGATFAHHYLQGYFETTITPTFGVWFIDYNRILGAMYENFQGSQTAPAGTTPLLTGQAGSAGKARGRVRLVDSITAAPQLEPDEILVCRMTTPDYLPLMQQAAAIVTDMGGILSHAAIVARELGKPCLTATRQATAILQDGQLIEVDADAGIVRAV